MMLYAPSIKPAWLSEAVAYETQIKHRPTPTHSNVGARQQLVLLVCGSGMIASRGKEDT
jgi:hypothetical protein